MSSHYNAAAYIQRHILRDSPVPAAPHDHSVLHYNQSALLERGKLGKKKLDVRRRTESDLAAFHSHTNQFMSLHRRRGEYYRPRHETIKLSVKQLLRCRHAIGLYETNTLCESNIRRAVDSIIAGSIDLHSVALLTDGLYKSDCYSVQFSSIALCFSP